MPYNHLPRILIKYLVMESAKMLVFLPAKHGVSKSPRMILHQENLDYKRYEKYTLCDYVLAHNDFTPTNILAPLALDCLYLSPSVSKNGHDFLHLQTNTVISRHNCTPLPIFLKYNQASTSAGRTG